jgi:hypothetical protein
LAVWHFGHIEARWERQASAARAARAAETGLGPDDASGADLSSVDAASIDLTGA